MIRLGEDPLATAADVATAKENKQMEDKDLPTRGLPNTVYVSRHSSWIWGWLGLIGSLVAAAFSMVGIALGIVLMPLWQILPKAPPALGKQAPRLKGRFLELVQAERFVALPSETFGAAGEPTARLFRGLILLPGRGSTMPASSK